MSGCGSGCSCGSDCKCGGGCGCGMYPDVEKAPTLILTDGITPVKNYSEGAEMVTEGGHACKCGPNCTCNPCTC